MDRRTFIGSAGAALSVAALHSGASTVAEPRRIRAVAFDGYAVFDATAVLAVAESVLPGKGRDFVTAWRARQFGYQWLRTLGGRYVDFAQTATDSLSFTLKSLALSVRAEERDRLLAAQLTLTPWPEASAEIARMRGAGLRLAFLSNMTEPMLRDCLAESPWPPRGGPGRDAEHRLRKPLRCRGVRNEVGSLKVDCAWSRR